MTWHVDTTLLRQYRLGQLGDARVASLELHLTACPPCRSLIAAEADAVTEASLARVKESIDDELHAKGVTRLQRALRGMGLGDSDAGVLVATLSLHGSWLAAFALALSFALLAAWTGPERLGVATFLVVAPLVPLLGVALAYGPRVDPTYEISLATSMPTDRIVLLRTVAVTVPALPVLLVFSLLLPGGLLAFAWLLPATGLATASLALGTLMSPTKVAVCVAVLWVMGAVTSLANAPRTSVESFVQGFAAFRPSGQVLCAAVAAISVVLAALRRSAFETAG